MKNMRMFILAISLICSGSYVSGAKAAIMDASFGLPGNQFAAPTLLLVGDTQGDHRGKAHNGKDVRKHETANDKDWGKRHERMMERIEDLPPEQQERARQRLEEMRTKREKIRAELEALPPEERKARMEELRRQHHENRKAHSEAFREEFRERWEDASSEKRAAFCDRAAERCDKGRARSCDFISDVCSE